MQEVKHRVMPTEENLNPEEIKELADTLVSISLATMRLANNLRKLRGEDNDGKHERISTRKRKQSWMRQKQT